jgi:hypothetical protein
MYHCCIGVAHVQRLLAMLAMLLEEQNFELPSPEFDPGDVTDKMMNSPDER